MQDSYQVSRPQLVRLYAANVACALIAGLAAYVGVRQIRTLRAAVRVLTSPRLRVR